MTKKITKIVEVDPNKKYALEFEKIIPKSSMWNIINSFKTFMEDDKQKVIGLCGVKVKKC